MTGLGLTTLVIGLGNAGKSGNIIVPLLSIATGVIVGEILDLDGALKRFGGWLQLKTTGRTGESQRADQIEDVVTQARIRFINGFVTASLVFCVGPLTVIGSLQNGINANDTQALLIKSTLDFFAAMAFAASLGIGVAFSVITIGVFQGGLALVGMVLASVLAAGGALSDTNPYIRELTATGGILLMGLALVLTNIKQPRMANFLPALVIVLLLVWLAASFGINIYPKPL